MRQGVNRECIRQGVNRECMRQGVNREWRRQGVHRECMRQGVHRECMRQGVNRECMRQGVHREWRRQGVHREWRGHKLSSDGCREDRPRGRCLTEFHVVLFLIPLGCSRRKAHLRSHCVRHHWGYYVTHSAMCMWNTISTHGCRPSGWSLRPSGR